MARRSVFTLFRDVLLLGCAALLLVSLAAPAVAQPAASATGDTVALYSLFGINERPVNHIVLLDISYSMKTNGVFPVARRALQTYLSTIGPNDKVEIILVGNQASFFKSGVGPSVANVVAKIPGPSLKSGYRTDMAAGFDAAIAQVERTPADTHIIVFLTDGQDDPPLGRDPGIPATPFPRAGSKPWGQLRTRLVEAAKQKDVLGFGVGIGDQGVLGSDLIKRVVPGAESYRVFPTALPGEFAGIREWASRKQLSKALVGEMRSGGVSATVSAPGSVRVKDGRLVLGTATVKNGYSHLPVTVAVETAAKADAWSGRELMPASQINTTQRVNLTLGPGESKTIDIVVEKAQPDLPKGIWPGSSTAPIALTAKVTGATSYPVGIQSFGLTPAIAASATPAGTKLAGTWGFPLWLAAAITALVVLAALLLARKLILAARPAVLSGSVSIERSGMVIQSVSATGKQAMTIGGGEDGDAVVTEPDMPDPVLRVSARRVSGKKVAYVEVLSTDSFLFDPMTGSLVPAVSGVVVPNMRIVCGALEVALNVSAA